MATFIKTMKDTLGNIIAPRTRSEAVYHGVSDTPLDTVIDGMQIEYGSNENGSWVKYPDGTIECYSTVLHNFQITDRQYYPFPHEIIFETGYYCYVNGSLDSNSSSPLWASMASTIVMARADSYWAVATTVTSGYSNPLHLIAIGRWKA